MYFCAAASSENDQGSMNLDFEHRPGALDHAVQSGSQELDDRVLDPPLDRSDQLAGVALVPVPVQGLGCVPKLHDKVAREVLGFGFAALLSP